ncbi:MAG: S8/S53 family peptidase [Proteobacteria bacterium]|nr:S8/S53 family peptidase [Pseudomonadota bacterium]
MTKKTKSLERLRRGASVAGRALSPLILAGLLGGQTSAATQEAAVAGFAEVAGSLQNNAGTDTGEFGSARMTVDVVLAPSNQAELSNLLTAVYDQKNAKYHQWLAKGEFESRFAPSGARVAELTGYLQASGLTVEKSASPFLLRASGSSARVAAALGTSLHNYTNKHGVSYYSNATSVRLPARLANGVLGVVGLSNTVRMQSHARRTPNGGGHSIPTPSCEAPYPTADQIFAGGFPFGYGGGPGCNGLTPSQVNSLYDAPNFGSSGQGRGVNLAVFELSAYQQSDIATWARQFYGAGFTPPLVDINVDGGPLAPQCPAGDTCPPNFNGYAGDIEVDADIEIQLAVSPAAKHILVYNAPNDFTGQTELDEYTRIAHDNLADVVSSSWAVCEQDVSAGYVQAENVIFQQMALQGQSVFGAEGDTGAFSCIRSDGSTNAAVLDPPAQPWVTSVGGTSFESFNPGANPHPQYPAGVETVWNVDNLCNKSADEGGAPGLFWCGATGAGGGGNSLYWGRPAYQIGPGIVGQGATFADASSNCVLAKAGTLCRAVPDISANADEFTPYAEFCTGNANTPFSVCGTFSDGQTPPGWFGIGGTSLSSPLISAIFANHDSFWHGRVGNVNPLLYLLYNVDRRGYFHDISGKGQTTNNNGLFFVLPGFDRATGVGTPKMGPLITLFPDND